MPNVTTLNITLTIQILKYSPPVPVNLNGSYRVTASPGSEETTSVTSEVGTCSIRACRDGAEHSTSDPGLRVRVLLVDLHQHCA